MDRAPSSFGVETPSRIARLAEALRECRPDVHAHLLRVAFPTVTKVELDALMLQIVNAVAVDDRGEPLAPTPEAAAGPEGNGVVRTAHLGDLANHIGDRMLWTGYLVRNHINLLSSDPKIGKTHLCLAMAKRLFFGETWPDGQACLMPAGARTLWVAGDRHQDELRERADAFGLPLEALLLNADASDPYSGWNLDADGAMDKLAERIERDRPAVAFVDTVWRATQKRMHKPEDVNALVGPLLTVAHDFDVTFILNMHLSANEETLGRRLEGAARSILKMFRVDGSPDRRRLEVAGNFKEGPPLGLTLTTTGCDFDSTPDPKAPRSQGRPGRPATATPEAMAFLRQELGSGDRVCVELRDEWLNKGNSERSFWDARKAMAADGSLVIDASGRRQVLHLNKGTNP